LREKNPLLGLYYSIGTSDLYPHKYQDFSSTGAGNLSAFDTAVNPATTADAYASISDDTTARN